ncbi:MAG: DNA-binding protein [Desulfobaccales bacterium]
MKALRVGVSLIMLIFLTATVCWAQGQGTQPGDVCRMYDPRTVETISGEVTAVGKFFPSGRSEGVRFTLKTDKGPVEVILGPGWYVEKQNFSFVPQDKVTVKGSSVAVEGKPTIIAAEITKDGKTLKLRDANGMPVWVPASAYDPGSG